MIRQSRGKVPGVFGNGFLEVKAVLESSRSPIDVSAENCGQVVAAMLAFCSDVAKLMTLVRQRLYCDSCKFGI